MSTSSHSSGKTRRKYATNCFGVPLLKASDELQRMAIPLAVTHASTIAKVPIPRQKRRWRAVGGGAPSLPISLRFSSNPSMCFPLLYLFCAPPAGQNSRPYRPSNSNNVASTPTRGSCSRLSHRRSGLPVSLSR